MHMTGGPGTLGSKRLCLGVLATVPDGGAGGAMQGSTNKGWHIAQGPLSVVFGILLGFVASFVCACTLLWNNKYKRIMVLVVSGEAGRRPPACCPAPPLRVSARPPVFRPPTFARHQPPATAQVMDDWTC